MLFPYRVIRNDKLPEVELSYKAFSCNLESS